MADRDVLEAIRDAFNQRHHDGDAVRVFESFSNFLSKRVGNAERREIGAALAYIANDTVFVALRPRQLGDEAAVSVKRVEWAP